MRLIDADVLDGLIEEEFDGVCVYDVSPSQAVYDFQDIVCRAPTAKALPLDWLYQRLSDRKKNLFPYHNERELGKLECLEELMDCLRDRIMEDNK